MQELIERYGTPWAGPEAYHKFEQSFMKLWRSEVWEAKFGLLWGLPFKRIYCHQDLLPLLDQTFQVLAILGLANEITTFDGCWNVRRVRGSEDNPRWSIHSFGLAIDLNAAENPMGGPVKFSTRFLAAMKACGWTCGADFHRKDGMHFQWVDNC
jgi:hypothetical protein